MANKGLGYEEEDIDRPWGGFWVINKHDLNRFLTLHFEELAEELLKSGQELKPKYLLVAPQARLSWQYHRLRSELWRVIEGPVGVMVSNDDVQTKPKFVDKGELVRIRRGQRHRLIGGDDWGLVAEIWLHEDPGDPSTESDVVRLEDDYGR